MAKVKMDLIKPNPNQPRKFFAGIEELAESIKEKGLLEPVILRAVETGFEIVCGERRFRACKMAGLEEIEAVIRDISDKESFELSLIENIQRENFNPIEEGRAFKELCDKGYKQSQIANIIKKSQSYVAHKIRLLELPEPLQFFISEKLLSENHIRQILKLKKAYGEDFPSDRIEGLIPDFDSGEKHAVAWFLCQIRPEEGVIYFPIPGNKPEREKNIIKACRIFWDYVSKHNFEVNQWAVSSFWTACLSYYFEMSVLTISKWIDRYIQRYEHTLVHFNLLKEKRDGNGLNFQKDIEDFWGYYGDLSHSSYLGIGLENIDMAVFNRVIDYPEVKKGRVLPSIYQKIYNPV